MQLSGCSSTNQYRLRCASSKILRFFAREKKASALIGVAAVFQASLKCGYLASLWEKDIARGLLWDVTRYEAASSLVRRYKRSSVPSWSWASMVLETEDSGIVFPAGHDESFRIDSRFTCVNTNVPINVMDSNFGTPNNEIWVRGAVVMAICCAHCESIDEENTLTLLFERDVEDAILITALGMKLGVTGRIEENTVMDGSAVHCILVGSTTEAAWTCNDQVTYLCTCILRLPIATSDHLERIGILDIRDDTEIFHSASEMVLKLT